VSSLEIALIAFACVFGSALLGLFLRGVLPEHHLSAESKDLLKLGIGLIATMSALVLGLLVSSAKGTFDRISEEEVQTAAKIVMLDRVLAQYGPETKEIRDVLRSTVASVVQVLFSEDASVQAKFDTTASVARGEDLVAKIRALSPQNDDQRSLKAQALEISGEVLMARWLMIAQGRSISTPFLVVLVAWLSIIFAGFGLFAHRNATVVTTLFVCALSVSAALFMILELDTPLNGLLRVSSAPLRNALAHLGQ